MDASSLLGRTVARRYRIEELVGSGAMGDVFRARHIELDNDVAVKILRASTASDDKFKERFYREAKAASRLEHANSVRVLDFGQEEDGLTYLVMEFLRGRDLLTVLREEWPLADERVVDIAVQTLAAMSLAHGLGIVHRDLKPENIMIVRDGDDDQRDCVKVCDFGIAKLNDARAFKSKEDITTALTADSALIGTPEYMSPEQARGEPLDARSDLYSVGVVLFRMLTGKLPFDAENAIGLAVKHITEPPPLPSSVVPQVNVRLEAICLKALRKEPGERYATAKEMRADLRAALGGRMIAPSAPSMREGPAAMAVLEHAATLRAQVDGQPATSEPPPRRLRATVDHPVALPFESRRRLVGVVSGLTILASLATWLFVWAKKPDHTDRATGLVAAASESASASGTKLPPIAIPTASDGAKAKGRSARSGPAHPPSSRPGPAALPPVASVAPPSSAAPEPLPSAAASHPASAPEYKPANALVSFQSLTADRVQKAVIERKLSETAPRLNECYRDALFMTGGPVGGTAEIHMSIDATGKVVSVVIAPQLPPFQRCVARLLSGQSIPQDAVDPGGGTAAQILKLTP